MTERDDIAARWAEWCRGRTFTADSQAQHIADFVLSERARLFAEPSDGMVAAMTGIISDYIDEWRGPADAKDAHAALRALGEAAGG